MTAELILAVTLLLAYYGKLWAADRDAGRKHAKDMKALETPKAPPAPREAAK